MVFEKFAQEVAESGNHFARFSVTPNSLFGEDQLTVDDDFKEATARWNEPPGRDVIFKLAFVQNFCRQTDSTFGVVSGRAVGDADVQNGVIHRSLLFFIQDAGPQVTLSAPVDASTKLLMRRSVYGFLNSFVV